MTDPAHVRYDGADPAWSCRRKKAYPTEAVARRVAVSVLTAAGVSLRPYACELCGMWHVGASPRRTVDARFATTTPDAVDDDHDDELSIRRRRRRAARTRGERGAYRRP